MNANNRFNGGRMGAVFKCDICGKQTRDTGHDEASLGMCKRCLFECYVDNAAADYGAGSPQHNDAMAALKALK